MMRPRPNPRRHDCIGIQDNDVIGVVMITHTHTADACDIVQAIIHDYDIRHTVRTRIDLLWNALDTWCDARAATATRIHGTLPDYDQALLPVVVPATHSIAIWALGTDRRHRRATHHLDTVSVAQFLRGPLATMRQRWMQRKTRHDDDEGHMRHLFFHD